MSFALSAVHKLSSFPMAIHPRTHLQMLEEQHVRRGLLVDLPTAIRADAGVRWLADWLGRCF